MEEIRVMLVDDEERFLATTQKLLIRRGIETLTAASGMEALNESIDLGERTGERWFEAEAYRCKGELWVQMAASNSKTSSDLVEAEACYLAALDLARQQQAKMLELRAITSLSQLWQIQGKGDAAIPYLIEIIDWFTEGFETLDLRQAKALLAVLKD